MSEETQEQGFNPFGQEIKSDETETPGIESQMQEESQEESKGESASEEKEDSDAESQEMGMSEQAHGETYQGSEELKDPEADPRPTYDLLIAKHPISWSESNKGHQQIWGRECNAWAKRNGHHFLGFCIESGDPLFKKAK